ncbi:hypothetical protein ACJQWY_02275 [Weissella kandleri]|uniref:hypothetical protein n=1 Tax=Weissella kandleri TaxID=1616 RepID=UPI00387E4AD0
MVELTALNINEILSDEALTKMIEANPKVEYADGRFTVREDYLQMNEDEDSLAGRDVITFEELRNAYQEYFYALDYFMSSAYEEEDYIDRNGKEKDGKLIFTPLDEMLPLDDWSKNEPVVKPLRDAYTDFEYELKFLADLGVEMKEFEGVVIEDEEEDED